MAQTDRAILLANAIATSMRGLRANMRVNELPSGAGLRKAERMTAIAQMINRRRMSRCPVFDVLPRICLPPVECWRGTRPSQAAKSRPRLKTLIGGAKVSIAIAVTGPTPASSAVGGLWFPVPPRKPSLSRARKSSPSIRRCVPRRRARAQLREEIVTLSHPRPPSEPSHSMALGARQLHIQPNGHVAH